MFFFGDFIIVEFDLSIFIVLIKMVLLNVVIYRIFCGMNFFVSLNISKC